MAQASVVAFNIGAFISTLFLLDFGANKFIAHTAIVAAQIQVSEVVIGLLTAGAEWEELAVVVTSLAQGRSSLALGNVIGASISNILGAFSLGLLCYKSGDKIEFDRSSRIYSLMLLILTTSLIPIIYYATSITWLVCGLLLIAAFGAYFLLVALAISRGVLMAPEDSDDSDIDDDDDDTNSVRSSTGLLANTSTATRQSRQHHNRHTLNYHGFYLFVGFLANKHYRPDV